MRPGIVHDYLLRRLIRHVIDAIATRDFAFPCPAVHRSSQWKFAPWIASRGAVAKIFVPPQGILRGTIDQCFPVTVYAAVSRHNQPDRKSTRLNSSHLG